MSSKNFIKIFLLLLISVSCSQEDATIDNSNIVSIDEKFAMKNVEILDELGHYFPKEDITFTISKDEEGKLFSIYKLIGQTKDEIDLGSFAKRKFKRNDEGGTTCDGKWSCGRLLYQCLSNGDSGMISNGGCDGSNDGYCVVCVPQEQ